MQQSPPKDHIEALKAERLSWQEGALKNLANSIDINMRTFMSRGHFIMEFIQNSDDARSSSMQIDISQDRLVIYNNGEVFNADDVNSICSVGDSSKDPSEYIGYLGIGFKSVYLLTENPSIVSGGYCFQFSREHWPSERSIPWQITPIWIDDSLGEPSEHQDDWNTSFDLPFKPSLASDVLERLFYEITIDKLNPRLLLFLRHLKTISIKNHVDQTARQISLVEDSHDADLDARYISISDRINDEPEELNQYLMFSKETLVPESVASDATTREWQRDGIRKREVCVVFCLDENNNLVPEKRGTSHTGVFSYLPLKEESIGIRFSFQGDFLTSMGREGVHRDASWNKWLSSEVANLITDKCVPAFKKHKQWKFNFTEVLYPSEEGAHPLWDSILKKKLSSYLIKENVLLAIDGTFCNTEEAITVSPLTRSLLSRDQWVRSTYEWGVRLLHKDCSSPLTRNIRKKTPFQLLFAEANKERSFFNHTPLEDELLQRLDPCDFDWFERLYCALSDDIYHNDDYVRYGPQGGVYPYQNSMMKKLKPYEFILTDDCTLLAPEDVVIPPESDDLDAAWQELGFHLVHPEMLASTRNSKVNKLLTVQLNIERISKDHYARKWLEVNLPNLRKNWPAMSTEDRLSNTLKLRWLNLSGMFTHQLLTKELSFLEVLTKSGAWVDPRVAIFSSEYQPGHNLETIAQNGLADRAIHFLDPVYLDTDEEIGTIRKLMQTLGVEGDSQKAKQEAKSISERIGVVAAIQYETERGRSAHELGQSEKDAGYDIISGEEGVLARKIEAKGSQQDQPMIGLTSNERKAMFLNDNWYLYIVAEAWVSPTLYVINSMQMRELDSKLVSYEAKQWLTAIEDETTLL